MRILAIHTFPGASAGVERHFPYYEKAGADLILGITTIGGRCRWPGAHTFEIGPDSYVNGAHLPERLLRTIGVCLEKGATEIIVTEWDSIFLKPIPAPLPKGLSMVVTGLGSPGFQGKRYFHPPWAMDAETAKEVLRVGWPMISDGMIERGFPDRFIGLLAEVGEIQVHTGHFRAYSQNALDRPRFLTEARQARLSGVHFIHGLKSKEQLDFVMSDQ